VEVVEQGSLVGVHRDVCEIKNGARKVRETLLSHCSKCVETFVPGLYRSEKDGPRQRCARVRVLRRQRQCPGHGGRCALGRRGGGPVVGLCQEW
jgi:hypothetical protein